MGDIVRKLGIEEYKDFLQIAFNAYPGIWGSAEEKEKFEKWFNDNIPTRKTEAIYGLFREGKLLGGMKLLDLKMQLLSQRIPIGGVGMVCVDIMHKKEKVAKELITYFINHYKNKGVNLLMLYPFRVDFYKKMGFGYGTTKHQYKIKASAFPKGDGKENIDFLNFADREEIINCYNRYLSITNGMIEKREYEFDADFFKHNRVVGYKKNGNILGYLVFDFKKPKPDCPWISDMIVKEFVYETREALLELCAFMNTQSDQINRVVIETENEDFHYLFSDPSNGNYTVFNRISHEMYVTGTGCMYRVIDVKGIFEALQGHNFGTEDCKLKLTVSDDFFTPNNGSTIIHFEKGKSKVCDIHDQYDVEISLDISEFSSLIMGAVDFNTLYGFALADISDTAHIPIINRIFGTSNKPICTTFF